MSNSIKVSPKHGVNPTIPVCFFCGESKNELALLGKIDKQDSEAPKNMVMDYEPCDHCKENMEKGVALIAVTTRQPLDKRPPISVRPDVTLYPTGGWLVITEKAAQELFEDPELKKGSKAFVTEEMFKCLTEDGE